MKKNLLLLLALIILIIPACQEKIDVDKEKQAIITALNDESAAYVAMDSTKWFSYWVQDESTARVSSGKDGYSITQGWKQLYIAAKETLENDTLSNDWKDMKFTKSDFNIKVYSDCAWASFNEKFTATYKGEPYESEDIQLRILEKIEGQWKIAFLGSIDITSYKTAEAAEPAE